MSEPATPMPIAATLEVSDRMGLLPAGLRIVSPSGVEPGDVVVALTDVCGGGRLVLESPGWTSTVQAVTADGGDVVIHCSNGLRVTVPADHPVGLAPERDAMSDRGAS